MSKNSYWVSYFSIILACDFFNKTKSAFLCYYLRIKNRWHKVHTKE